MKQIHYITGLLLSAFTGLHLFNHFCSLWGAEKHIAVMNSLRPVYRNAFIEGLIVISVIIQISSGIMLFSKSRKSATTTFEKLHVYTGLYLAFFLVIHLAAVFSGRLYLHLNTNFYFGVAGLNTFPLNLFFIPYYGLAIISFFGHIAAVHSKKMKRSLWGLTPAAQANAILFTGILLTFVIFLGLTNFFSGVKIPDQYNILIGK